MYHKSIKCHSLKYKKSVCQAQQYFEKCKIRINQTKIHTMIFSYKKSPKRIPTTALEINGSEIIMVDTLKYLGVIMDKKRNFAKHCNRY